eukprot:CAMPEP_0179471050 /NCGR_PEP_ID=MMETSP0799-20121207/51367_1 /TAXON_ID=46947 /ORGANISM="Geminigera cryophila, Strain CCMP2564" /LENGTH=48 /DNA_ID= /DNA_START= /DNA_END= /DNA_ORIENTATION=
MTTEMISREASAGKGLLTSAAAASFLKPPNLARTASRQKGTTIESTLS